MIPVEQRTGYDCLTACLASIFEVDYEDVPLFCDADGEPVERWHSVFDAWLCEQGFASLERMREAGDPDDPMRCPWHFPGYWIAGVLSPRYDGSHAVVMCGGTVSWDPHPQRGMGHRGFESATYFLPLDPARLVLVEAVAT